MRFKTTNYPHLYSHHQPELDLRGYLLAGINPCQSSCRTHDRCSYCEWVWARNTAWFQFGFLIRISRRMLPEAIDQHLLEPGIFFLQFHQSLGLLVTLISFCPNCFFHRWKLTCGRLCFLRISAMYWPASTRSISGSSLLRCISLLSCLWVGLSQRPRDQLAQIIGAPSVSPWRDLPDRLPEVWRGDTARALRHSHATYAVSWNAW